MISNERLEEIRDFDTCVTLEESAEMAARLLSAARLDVTVTGPKYVVNELTAKLKSIQHLHKQNLVTPATMLDLLAFASSLVEELARKRTISVKLPFRFQDSTMATIWENEGIERCNIAFQKACDDAGIKLIVERT